MKPKEPPLDAAYRVIAKSLRKPRVQKVTPEMLEALLLSAKLEHGILGHAIAHAERLLWSIGADD